LRKNNENYTEIYKNAQNYYKTGDSRTYKKQGGLVFYAPFDKFAAKFTFQEIKRAIDIKMNYLSIEIFTYSNNIGSFVWTIVKLDLLNSGKVQSSVENISFRVTQYTGKRIFRVILEILAVLFIFYYLYIELSDWFSKFENLRKIDNEGDNIENYSGMAKIGYFLYINPNEFNNSNFVFL